MTDNIQLEPAVIDAINRGRTIDAIKMLRQSTGIGLKEAKDLVDQYSSQGYIDAPSEVQSTSARGDLHFNHQVIDALNRGRKIEAIKLLRESRRIGLKEAKELVDRYCDENKLAVQSSGESNFLSYLAVAIVIGLVAYFVYRLI